MSHAPGAPRSPAQRSACSSRSTSRGPTASSSARRSTRSAGTRGGSWRAAIRSQADLVIAIPDSSNAAAQGFAEEAGLPFELGLIRNHYVGRTFIQAGAATIASTPCG